jgi:hypothetical protein
MTRPLEQPQDLPSPLSTWPDGQVLATQLGLPRRSCVSEVPHGQTGSSLTQCAMPDPIRVHFWPARHAAGVGVLAHAPGISRHRASSVIVPSLAVGAVWQPLVSYSLDSATSPLGQVFVIVLYLDPIMPGPHSASVDWIAILYGVQLTGAVCANVVPLTQNASRANIFPMIFKDIPLLSI